MTAAVSVRPLTEVLEELRAKGLRKGVGPIPGRPPVEAVPTGHSQLDAALGTAGWPRGGLALLDAPPGTGATSLALGSLATCQAGGGLVAWLDLEGVFDASTAARLGVRLEWLLVARPRDPREAVELGAWLARSRLIDVFVLDFGLARPDRALERLPALLARTGAAGLVLAPRGRDLAGRLAGVRVELERRAWLAVGRDLVGQRVAATVTRHRWAATGARAELDLWFAEGRRIDPLLPPLARARHREAAAVAEFEQPALRVLSA